MAAAALTFGDVKVAIRRPPATAKQSRAAMRVQGDVERWIMGEMSTRSYRVKLGVS
jgi:hypothetical protein